MAHQDQRPQRAQWQKETFNNLGKGRKVGCKWGHEAGLRESCGGRKQEGQWAIASAPTRHQQNCRGGGPQASIPSASVATHGRRQGRGPTALPRAPRRPVGWGCPPLHTTWAPLRLQTQPQGARGTWAHPPTFQRFPHSLQTTNVVMGSSELRVCTCRRDVAQARSGQSGQEAAGSRSPLQSLPGGHPGLPYSPPPLRVALPSSGPDRSTVTRALAPPGVHSGICLCGSQCGRAATTRQHSTLSRPPAAVLGPLHAGWARSPTLSTASGPRPRGAACWGPGP